LLLSTPAVYPTRRLFEVELLWLEAKAASIAKNHNQHFEFPIKQLFIRNYGLTRPKSPRKLNLGNPVSGF
jgi:hypothetical protein